MKWLGIISHRVLFLKEQWLVLAGYLSSLKEILFSGEKERRRQSNLFFCLSFFGLIQKKKN